MKSTSIVGILSQEIINLMLNLILLKHEKVFIRGTRTTFDHGTV